MVRTTEPANRNDPNTVYLLGRSAGEKSRRQRQAEELRAANTALLNRVPLRPGDAAIDLGCGPLGILDLLWERLQPAGRGGWAWMPTRTTWSWRTSWLRPAG